MVDSAAATARGSARRCGGELLYFAEYKCLKFLFYRLVEVFNQHMLRLYAFIISGMKIIFVVLREAQIFFLLKVYTEFAVAFGLDVLNSIGNYLIVV